MKKWTVIVVAAVLLVGVSIAWAASVEPEAWPNLQIGDAAHYCVTTLGYDFGLKIEAWGGKYGAKPPDGNYSGAYDGQGMLHEDFENVITISNATRYAFDWASAPYAIGAVVVQGGWMDNIFFYNPALSSDTHLYPFDSGTAKMEQISHINLCWNKTGDNGEDECYQDETAWGDGLPYVEQGNWAMYTPYAANSTVDLVAGQNMLAGAVHFSEAVNGLVQITISLNEPFIFYYDLGDIEEDNNIKIQDYAEPPPPVNPAIGHFDWKAVAPFGSTEYTITVPANAYYGIHVDLAYAAPCE